MYVGDACSSVKGHYKTVFLGTDIEAIRESEKKFRKMNPEYICAGHGSPIHFTEEPENGKDA